MRSRNIKPGFCSDKKLLKCSVESHLLFAMLWMMADRNGLLVDDHEQIALDSFYIVRGLDCDCLLKELHNNGLITRYTSSCGGKYIKINNFHKHQNPHKNEAASEIPMQDDEFSDDSCNYASNHADSLIDDCGTKTSSSPKGDGEQGKEYSKSFLTFWAAYPKKKNKGDAFKAWKTEKCHKVLDEIVCAVSRQTTSHDWQKDGGQFIPYPGSYLRARAWEDEDESCGKSAREIYAEQYYANQ